MKRNIIPYPAPLKRHLEKMKARSDFHVVLKAEFPDQWFLSYLMGVFKRIETKTIRRQLEVA